MKLMTKPWWKRRTETDAERVIAQAPNEPPVYFDIERMERSLQSPEFILPNDLSPEEARQFIIAIARGHK